MSSNPKRITRPLSRINKMPSIMTSGSNNKKTGNDHTPPRQPQNTKPDHSKPCQSGVDDEGGRSSPSTSSSDGGDAESRGNKDAEAEGLEEDDGDSDGMAPSGCTIDQDGKQAGPIIEKSIISLIGTDKSRKRRLDSPDVYTNRHKTLKRTREAGVADEKSDDEDYAGVDLISDGEEGEPSVEQEEENMIIDSEEENDFAGGSMFVPAPASDTSDDGWGGSELVDGFILSDIQYFDEQIGRTDPSELANEAEIFNAASFFDDLPFSVPTIPEPRRVRFAEPLVPYANTSGTDSDEETGPSPFPRRRMLNPRSQAKIGLKDKTPMWGCDETEEIFGSKGLIDNFEDSCGNSSGYETDLGETTEEEDLPPSITARRQPRQSNDSMSSQNHESIRTSAPANISATYSAGARWGPRMGSWVADPTKPIAIIDHTGNSLIILPAKRPAKTSGHLNENHGNERLSSPVTGSPEPFYSFDGFAPGSGMLDDQDDDDDDEALLNVHDFINFGDDSDESEEGIDGSPPSTIQSMPVKTQAPAQKDSFIQNPGHFDKGVVTAFRRNQQGARARRHSQEGFLSHTDVFAARLTNLFTLRDEAIVT